MRALHPSSLLTHKHWRRGQQLEWCFVISFRSPLKLETKIFGAAQSRLYPLIEDIDIVIQKGGIHESSHGIKRRKIWLCGLWLPMVVLVQRSACHSIPLIGPNQHSSKNTRQYAIGFLGSPRFGCLGLSPDASPGSLWFVAEIFPTFLTREFPRSRTLSTTNGSLYAYCANSDEMA